MEPLQQPRLRRLLPMIGATAGAVLIFGVYTLRLFREVPVNEKILWWALGLLVLVFWGMSIWLLKGQVRRLGEDEARIRLMIERTGTILYEWEMEEDVATFSSYCQRKFGIPTQIYGFSKVMERDGQLHPKDKELFNGLLEEAKGGKSYGERVVRLRGIDGNYFWNRISLLTIYDGERHAVGGMGLIIDVNDEKREAQNYKSRAERDSLTGLYNKGAAETLIRQYLQGEGQDGLHALLMVDLDNFKTINDSLGHLCGDRVLVHTAKQLQQVFRASDIMGRVGGDEFVVLLKDLVGEEVALEKADAICHLLGQIEEGGCSVSGSVGLALYPRDGECYQDLYHRADMALYRAKHLGKNRQQLYEAQGEDTP